MNKVFQAWIFERTVAEISEGTVEIPRRIVGKNIWWHGGIFEEIRGKVSARNPLAIPAENSVDIPAEIPEEIPVKKF